MTTIAFVNAATARGTSSPVAATLDTTSKNEIVVGIVSDLPASGITDTVGTVYSRKASVVVAFPNSRLASLSVYVELWSGTAAGSNVANSISVAFPSVNRASICATQYSGVSAEGYTSTNSGTSVISSGVTVSPTGVTQTVQDDKNFLVMVIGSAGNVNDPGSFNAVSGSGTIRGQIVTFQPSSKFRVGLVDNTVSPPGPVTCTVVLAASGFGWGAVAIELKTVKATLRPYGTMSTRNDPASQNGARL